MTKEGHAVALLSGELTVDQRAAVIGRFRAGKEKVLITTNVSARGRGYCLMLHWLLPMSVQSANQSHDNLLTICYPWCTVKGNIDIENFKNAGNEDEIIQRLY